MQKISNGIERKFIESFDIEDWEIETDTGWEDITSIHKTIPYEKWKLITESGLELICADDHIVFLENYEEIFVKNLIVGHSKIITKNGLELVIHLENLQEEDNMYDITVNSNNHRFYSNGILSHNTTVVTAYLLWLSIFKDNHKIGIAANKEKMAIEIVDRYKFSFEQLPLWLKHGVVEWNKAKIVLENGSIVMAEATSENTFRGRDINTLYCDEVAFVGNNIFEEFYASIYPSLSSGNSTKMFMTSTPKGLNMFYKLWTDAVAGRNIFKPLEVKWWMVPGRDEKWKETTINGMPNKEKWKEEFECDFLGSSNTLVSGEKLACLSHQDPIEKFSDMDIYEKPYKEEFDDNGNLINTEHFYVMTVDIAEGKNLDYSAFSVFDVSSFPYKQVAKYRSKTISPLLFPNVIKTCAEYYNNAHVLIEINCQPAVASSLVLDLEYEYVFRVYSGNKQPQKVDVGGRNGAYGVKTVHNTKINGCSNLKALIENDKLIIKDFDTINELSTFIGKGKSFQADENCHDDLVMTLVMFGWLCTQEYFKNLTELDIRKNLEIQHYGTANFEEDIPSAKSFNLNDGLQFPFEISGGDIWFTTERPIEEYFSEWFGNI